MKQEQDMKSKARVIAMYLPQYHPIPENDEWWGKGFTEWTNVGKAKPLFRGHYQPRVPADLGYYDLRLPVVREQQAELAREAGVEGFMYWHYWFGNGKTLLAEIFDDVVKSGKPDFPFCLGWANHSWTNRTWNSSAQYQKSRNLLVQTYPGDDDIIAHFNNVLPAFQDKRYITVDGKPLFVIYAPLDYQECSHFIAMWRDLAIKAGLKGIHFVGLASGWESNYQKTLDLGFDALTLSNIWNAQVAVNHGKILHLIRSVIRDRFPRWAPLDKYPYKEVVKHLFCEWDRKENGYPQIIPNWDRSPRGGRRATIYTGSTPELFRQHVLDALHLVEQKQEEHKILFLRSWNEWAEGNYMEPDLKFGHGYLDALKDALTDQ